MSGGAGTTPEQLRRCERCGVPLATSDAVCGCASVEAAPAGNGRYVCPACSTRFERHELQRAADAPPLPWYQLARDGLLCPRCGVWLRLRHPVGQLNRAMPTLLLVVLAVSYIVPLIPSHDRWLRIALWLALLIHALVNLRRVRTDPRAYERDPQTRSA